MNKNILTIGAVARCPLCGCKAELRKTALGWICLPCLRRLLGSK